MLLIMLLLRQLGPKKHKQSRQLGLKKNKQSRQLELKGDTNA